MPKEYSLMSRVELEAERKRLRAELEDLEETLAFNITHTSVHIPGKVAVKDEEELEKLRKEIAEIEKLLRCS